jgi:hypothetical protein
MGTNETCGKLSHRNPNGEFEELRVGKGVEAEEPYPEAQIFSPLATHTECPVDTVGSLDLRAFQTAACNSAARCAHFCAYHHLFRCVQPCSTSAGSRATSGI